MFFRIILVWWKFYFYYWLRFDQYIVEPFESGYAPFRGLIFDEIIIAISILLDYLADASLSIIARFPIP